MEKKDTGEELSKTLLKVALGFKVAEVTEEFAEVDGELKLTKRKRIKKDVPPDLKAVQLLLSESGGGGVSAMSDEELEREKQRLLAILEKNGGGTKTVVTQRKAKCDKVEKKEKDVGQGLDESQNAVAKTESKRSTQAKAKPKTKAKTKPCKRVVKTKKENKE